MLEKLRKGIREILTGRKDDGQSDTVSEKLRDLHWNPNEDEESVRRQAAGSGTEGDNLADIAYRARPNNPLSGDD